MRRSLGAILVVLLASACGQKGPLVLPDAQKQRSAKPLPGPAASTATDALASAAADPSGDAEPAPAH
jgi:predicted small lipoprotein YifL